MKFLVFFARRIKPGTVIEELREGVGEDLHDDDDNTRHDNPFRNLGEKIFLNHLAEAKTKDEHNDGGNDSRPKHETLAESFDIHNIVY